MTSTTLPTPAPRALALDAARAALMAWIVVVVHGIFWLQLVPLAPASLLLFEMPPVFMIAGASYFMARRAEERRGEEVGYGGYLLQRAVRIMAPYLAYALVCAALFLFINRDTGLELRDIAETLAAWINPATRGAGHTTLMLSWHLWFIAPFLGVTALMPFVTPKHVSARVRLWMFAAAATLLMFAIEQLDFPQDDLVQTIVFYAIWAAFGFLLAAAPARFRARDYALVLVLAVTALACGFAFFPEHVSLNMQANKFPPNTVFFLFSAAWVSLLLIALRWLTPARVEALARSALVRPFMRAGYSIYLWQGLGYSAAVLIGRQFGWSVWLVWPIAVAITVTLGLIAAPLERIRFGR